MSAQLPPPKGTTMTTPDFLPVLSGGAHVSPEEGACIMEYVSLLAGEEWSDSPACTHPVLARMAQVVNDRLPDSERYRLVPLIGRLFGTAETGTEHERQVLRVRLAVWCARQVLDGLRREDRAVAELAIEEAEGWCEGRVSVEECVHAADAVYADAAVDAATATAADAIHAAEADRLVGFLIGLLDEYDRLTGRTEYRQVTDDDLRTLAAGVGSEAVQS